MNRVLAGLLAAFVVGLPASATARVAGGVAHGPDHVLQAGPYAELMRPIPVAMPNTRGAEIATAAPARVMLVRHRRHGHRRPRRQHRDQAASHARPGAWLG